MARCSVHGIKSDVKDHAQGGCSHSPTASICAVMCERKIKATGSMLQLLLACAGSEGMRHFTGLQLESHPSRRNLSLSATATRGVDGMGKQSPGVSKPHCCPHAQLACCAGGRPWPGESLSVSLLGESLSVSLLGESLSVSWVVSSIQADANINLHAAWGCTALLLLL